jgi:hypothetical protein
MFWHLANSLAPALGLGMLAAALAKLVWRQRLRTNPYRRLASWSCGAALACSVSNLVLMERDGQMLGYAALTLAAATGLWWAAFGPGARGSR